MHGFQIWYLLYMCLLMLQDNILLTSHYRVFKSDQVQTHTHTHTHTPGREGRSVNWLGENVIFLTSPGKQDDLEQPLLFYSFLIMSQVPSTLQATLSNTLQSRVTGVYWWNTAILLPPPQSKGQHPQGLWGFSGKSYNCSKHWQLQVPPFRIHSQNHWEPHLWFHCWLEKTEGKNKSPDTLLPGPQLCNTSSPEWRAKKSPSAWTLHRKHWISHSLSSGQLWPLPHLHISVLNIQTPPAITFLPSFLYQSVSPGVCWRRSSRGHDCRLTHRLPPGNQRLLTSPRFLECTFYPLFPNGSHFQGRSLETAMWHSDHHCRVSVTEPH